MTKIGIVFNKKLIYSDFPYNPDQTYPELDYDYKPQPNNLIYKEMRNLFIKMGYDKDNFDTKNWNPLGFLIKKGEKVLIKPNFVMNNDKSPFSVITHPSIIRFLIDYAYKAAGDLGEIIIGDTPQASTDIKKILKYAKINKLINYLNDKKIPVKFYDFRNETIKNKRGIGVYRTKLKNISNRNKIIDLKENSLLFDLEKNDKARFYGADYNRKYVNYFHNKHRNTYCISKLFLKSDVVINIPKLKTHKKTGVTLNLKNIVGINTNKNYLPHYRIGCPNQNGDSFPNMNSFLNYSRFLRYVFRDAFLTRYYLKLARFFYRLLNQRKYVEALIINLFFPKFHSSYFSMVDGNWFGNDTIWRTVLDLNIIALYSNENGILKNARQRKFFSVIDGIIAGEKDGPLNPTPRKGGTIIMGEDMFLTDLVAIKLMGFNYKKIPLMHNAFLINKFPIIEKKKIKEILIISNNNTLNYLSYDNLNLNLDFEPPIGWMSIKRKNKMKGS